MSNVTVVIPTLKNRNEIPTLDCIPENVPVLLQKESPISKARNMGVKRANTDYIIQLDDDIQFSMELWNIVVENIDPNTVVGMEDWDYGLIVTRVIGFHKDAWTEVDGFDERLGSHMEDTDFAIKLAENNYNICSLEQDMIEHIPHKNRISTFDRFWRLGYLCLKHPKYIPSLLRGSLV